MDSGEKKKKQEAEEDGSDLRQGGWNENGCDGDVAKRQKKVQNILNTVSGGDWNVYATCEGRVLRRDDEIESEKLSQ